MDEQNNQKSAFVGQEKSKSLGPTIGLVVILVLIILGSLYFFKNKTKAPTINSQSSDQVNLDEGETDELAEIEADLKADDLSNVDSDFNSAEQEANKL